MGAVRIVKYKAENYPYDTFVKKYFMILVWIKISKFGILNFGFWVDEEKRRLLVNRGLKT